MKIKNWKQFNENYNSEIQEEEQIKIAKQLPEIKSFLVKINFKNFYNLLKADRNSTYISEDKVLIANDTMFYYHLGEEISYNKEFSEWYDSLDRDYQDNIINTVLENEIIDEIKRKLGIIVEW